MFSPAPPSIPSEQLLTTTEKAAPPQLHCSAAFFFHRRTLNSPPADSGISPSLRRYSRTTLQLLSMATDSSWIKGLSFSPPHHASHILPRHPRHSSVVGIQCHCDHYEQSILNGSNSNLVEATGRPFAPSFAAQSANPRNFHHSEYIDGRCPFKGSSVTWEAFRWYIFFGQIFRL